MTHHHHTEPQPTNAPSPLATVFPEAAVVYISDERVAAAYHVPVGDFATVNDPAERAWLVANNWAYDSTSPALPGAYHRGNAGDWPGYPPPAPSPSPPPAARRR